MTERLKIKDWALDERPREKLMEHGAESLSNAELLAILIGSGNNKETAVELMRRLMVDCNDRLQRLSRMSLQELTEYDGVGPAKAVTIMAACELGRRRASEHVASERMTSSERIAAYFRPKLQDLPHEECHVMLLSNALNFMTSRLIGKGGIAGSAADVRLVLHEALVGNAPNIALCHNHPSGSLRPSQADEQLTKSLVAACKVMNINLIDHIIVSHEGYYSFNDEGKL